MKVIIDPGHGGKDPGAIGPTGLKEKDVNWQIAVITAGELAKHGIKIMFTRNGDEQVSLDKRVQIANSIKADYFVSIHANSASNPKAAGTETFAYRQNIEGERLAYSIQQSLVREIELTDRGVKYADFTVIAKTTMPACLVEVAFINNPDEEKLLRNNAFLERAGVSIGKGILTHLGLFKDQPKPWQVEQGEKHLYSLVGKGIINTPEAWKDKLLEPIPAWAFFSLIDRITE